MNRPISIALLLPILFITSSLSYGLGASVRQLPAAALREAGQDKKTPQTKKAAAKAESEKRAKPRDPAIKDRIDQARLCPPAFAAKAMIRIATSGRVQDTGWKQEILEEAFDVVAEAFAATA